MAVSEEVPADSFRDLVESLSRGADAVLAPDYSNQDQFNYDYLTRTDIIMIAVVTLMPLVKQNHKNG